MALSALQSTLERVILDPSNRELLAIVKAARNGAVYGAKVRFPHALVMVFMFRSGTIQQKVQLVFKATRTHASNLARFAVIYKSACYALKYYGATPGKEGEYSPCNSIINESMEAEMGSRERERDRERETKEGKTHANHGYKQANTTASSPAY